MITRLGAVRTLPEAQERVRLLGRGGMLPVFVFVLRSGRVTLLEAAREFPDRTPGQVEAVLERLDGHGWLDCFPDALGEPRWQVAWLSISTLEAALLEDLDWSQPAAEWSLDVAIWEAGVIGLVAPRQSQLRLLLVEMLTLRHAAWDALAQAQLSESGPRS